MMTTDTLSLERTRQPEMFPLVARTNAAVGRDSWLTRPHDADSLGGSTP
ncbi:MAG TPA: hypothetical protein VN706_06550 [Gemmatimonadaceae bacterium]|nr:hypothetical protein [Gemmatimonadaceae bacterium]